MIFLKSFTLPTRNNEDKFLTSFPYQLEMQCYSHTNVYPFDIFPDKGLSKLDFEPITILYGKNGSGKSTLLNIIAKKLRIEHHALLNDTPCMDDFLALCHYELTYEQLPEDSRLISSDDVFDILLDLRAYNKDVDKRREQLFDEYYRTYEEPIGNLKSIADLTEFRRKIEVKSKTKSQYVFKRLPFHELEGHSNGENAFAHFTSQITENALYLLDEPENSLSAIRQKELSDFIEDSARYFGCQFIISTHSPFFLSIKNAAIYDLDTIPVSRAKWTDLENVRAYYELFNKRAHDFENNK